MNEIINQQMKEWTPNDYLWSSKHRIWNPARESLSGRGLHTQCALPASHPHTQNGEYWLDTGHSDPLANRHGTCQIQFSRLRRALRWTPGQRPVPDSSQQLRHKWNPRPNPHGKPHLWMFLWNAHGQDLFRLPLLTSLPNNQTASVVFLLFCCSLGRPPLTIHSQIRAKLFPLLSALKVYFICSLLASLL